MASRDDDRSKPAPARSVGRLPVAASGPPEPEALTQELRELHDRYGDGLDIPERLVDLARQVAEAYARLASEDDEPVPECRGPA